MSNIIATPDPGDWAEVPEMDYWREEVRKRAEAHLAEYPGAKRALEIANPEQAAEILYLLARGETWMAIRGKTGIDPASLSRLQRHHIGTLEKYRPILAQRFTQAAARLLDTLDRKIDQIESDDEAMSKTSLKDIAISLGVATDKASHLAGIATTVIEHRTGPTLEDAMSFRESIRQRIAEKAKGEAIDV